MSRTAASFAAAPLAALIALIAGAPAHAVDPPGDAGFEIDDAAAFRAAGFKLVNGAWQSCDGMGDDSYVPGQIDQLADLNGDGAPEALISESSAQCYGDTGTAYWLVGSDKAGKWHLIAQGVGVATVLGTRGKDNWPDLEVGGPGFCFPVLRWDGKAYALNRKEYEGKPCKG